MIDFTDYGVDAVTVNGVVIEDADDEVANNRVVELTSVVLDKVVQEGQYSMSVVENYVEVGLIGIIDFGVDQGDFTPDTFII